MVDTAGRAQSHGLLEARDYERIMKVLEDCSTARSLTEYREALLGSLASRCGYRHSTILVGPTHDRVFQDAGAYALGHVRLLPSCLEPFHRWDPLAQLAACLPASAPRSRPLILEAALPYLTPEHRPFFDQHLYPAGFHSVLVKEWAGTAAHGPFVLFAEEEGAFRARDITLVTRLGPILAQQIDLLAQLPQPSAWMERLTPREAEVARLVRHGCTNHEIASSLHITSDTVKKHVKAACVKAGAANRAGLAARMSGTSAGEGSVVLAVGPA